MKKLGIAALAIGALHMGWHLSHGDSWANLLWICNLAAILVGAGLIARRPAVVAIGTMWLLIGLPLWSIEMFAGGEFRWTSFPLHLLVPAIGLTGLRRIGVPRGVAWKALLGVGAVQALCRAITPPVENVNMVFAQQPEWRGIFPSYFSNYLAGLALHAIGFVLLEWALRRFISPAGRRGSAGAPG